MVMEVQEAVQSDCFKAIKQRIQPEQLVGRTSDIARVSGEQRFALEFLKTGTVIERCSIAEHPIPPTKCAGKARETLIAALEKEAERQLDQMAYRGDHGPKILEVVQRYCDGLTQMPIIHHISEAVEELIELSLERDRASQT